MRKDPMEYRAGMACNAHQEVLPRRVARPVSIRQGAFHAVETFEWSSGIGNIENERYDCRRMVAAGRNIA
mgnify:CR=1 FL=1